jgi:hypothetical protein
MTLSKNKKTMYSRLTVPTVKRSPTNYSDFPTCVKLGQEPDPGLDRHQNGQSDPNPSGIKTMPTHGTTFTI